MKQNFVTFYSPGTFVAEQTTLPIDSWDVDAAVVMSREIKERYNAVPYGFQFSVRERNDSELDSHESERSNFYYLGGEVFTLEQIKQKGNPYNEILIANMECNGWNRIIINTNSWSWTQPLKDDDIILSI